MTTTAFRRGPRVPVPGVDATPVTFQPPPEIPATTGTSPLMTLLPLLGGVGSMAFFVVGGSGAASWIGGGAMFASMLAMGAANVGRAGAKRRSQMTADRRDYLRHLGQVRTTVRGVADAQRVSLEQLHPVPEALVELARGQRLWERRPRDGDFAAVRLGTGPQRLAAPLEAPETGPAEDLEPVSAAALRRFVTAHRAVDGLPVAVALRSFSSVVLTGAPRAREDLARALLAQLATWHSPDEVHLAVLADRDRVQDWDWLKWLPHARHRHLRDAAGEARLWAPDPERLAALLADDLAGRGGFAPVTRAGALEALPFVVVLDDTGLLVPGDLAGGMAPAGLCVLGLADPGTVGPGPDRLVLELDPRPVRGRRAASASRAVSGLRPPGAAPVLGVAGEPVPVGVADALGPVAVSALARVVGTRRPARTGSDPVADPLSATTDLGALLGTGDLGALDVASSWRRGSGRHRLAVPLGVGPDGESVDLDLKESAAGGMGPHGLVIGATGSGKSELLRTLVLGLAVTHSSEVLNFVLIDFKGGATFAGLAELPHTAAVITNLADDLSMVDRMRDALAGEMNRRQEVLRAAGNHASVREYEGARAAGADLEPLPSLVVVCDEFSELLSAKPDFIDLFVAIGRLGRSLGVHLCLASQRLEEGRLRGLDSHLSYRIGLKTFSAQESRAVLGVPDAFELPPVPGSGYLKFDAGMWRFKGSYVSGPYGDGGAVLRPEPGAVRARGAAVAPFSVVPADAPPVALAATAHAAWTGGVSSAPVEAAVDRGGPLGPTLLDVVVDRLAGEGPPPHQVWLPPLDESPTLDDLLGPLSAEGGDGLRPLADRVDPVAGAPAPPAPSGLRVPIGIVDRPYEQRRDPLVLDLAGAAGHVAIVGGPQTGKSTALRTLVTALALTNTPQQLQVYAVDLGGGALGALGGLPHVGTVATRLQPDVVRRTIAEVARLLAVRERAFLDAGVESMAAWRAMRARGQGPDDGYGDVLLVIDGWASFRTEHEALEATVTDLAARGLSLGVHVVVTANRWAEIRASLKDLLGTRVELRLGDPGESEVDRRTAVTVPAGRPGRGLAADRRHLLVALPRADGQRRTDDLAEATTALARAVDGAWTGPRAPAVRMLPDLLVAAALPRVARTGCSIPVGVDEAALEPVFLDFDAEPHLLVFGDSESGKSGLLRLVARAVADRYSPEEARLLLIDPRRSLLGCAPAASLLGYASSTVAAAPLTAEVRTAMENRLPGPDVTAAQLRDRSWWRGPELFVVVDDYDLVATAGGNPVAPLADLLAQGGDIGLHLIVARRSGGAGRAMFDPVLGRLRDLAQPGLLLSGSKDEGVLVGSARPRPLPPGRAQLVTRRGGTSLVQLAWSPPA